MKFCHFPGFSPDPGHVEGMQSLLVPLRNWSQDRHTATKSVSTQMKIYVGSARGQWEHRVWVLNRVGRWGMVLGRGAT